MDTSALALVILWVAFFAFHSWLASNTVKNEIHKRLPGVYPRYRLLYNGIASVTILPALAIALLADSPVLWSWDGPLQWGMWLVTLLCFYGLLSSSRYYNMSVFLGLTPNEESHIGTPEESFTLSPYHRYVRHPWYFLGIVLIWIQDMTLYWFLSCILMTLYFWIGSRLEERKLVGMYGDRYVEYCKKVAGIIPLPWKIIGKTEADRLKAS